MKEFTWEIGPRDTVTLQISLLGRKRLLHNGELIERFAVRKAKPLTLTDGRTAELTLALGLVYQDAALRVDGEPVRLSLPGEKLSCPSCKAEAKPYDRFCESCGTALPAAQVQQDEQHLKAATGAVGTLAILFVLGGLVFYGIGYSQAQETLKKLAPYDAAAQWSVPVNGETVTVGRLREMIVQEPLSALFLNLFLAAVMAGLYVWAKKAPLPAVLVAAGTYLAVQVVSAIVEPTSIAQGIVMKIFIVTMLYRGIRAGIQQRALAG